MVNIGHSGEGTPRLGNNVHVEPGVIMFGKIIIADNIVIGANAVVNKSFETSDVTIAGVPAKIIKESGSNFRRATDVIDNGK